MSQPARTRSTIAIVGMAVAMVSGAIVKAQNGVTPYKVNYNWDKLEGRKIGVASGIKMDPDGTHLWILDRCGANKGGVRTGGGGHARESVAHPAVSY